MKSRKKYSSPAVLKEVPICLKTQVLAGSVVTKDTGVKTTGQEVSTYDFSSSSFNQEWE
jgi:hypothetical protein